ncbi:UNVERIFIED_CONTAM: snx14 [Trichonephila clavipes]
MISSMEGNEGVSMFKHIVQDKFFIGIFGFVIFLSVTFIILADTLSGLAVFSSFVVGCIGTHFLIRKRDRVPNFISTFKRQRKEIVGSKLRTVCSRCGIIDCKRHCPERNVYTAKPWMNLKVPKEVDQALEEVRYAFFLDKFFYSKCVLYWIS